MERGRVQLTHKSGSPFTTFYPHRQLAKEIMEDLKKQIEELELQQRQLQLQAQFELGRLAGRIELLKEMLAKEEDTKAK